MVERCFADADNSLVGLEDSHQVVLVRVRMNICPKLGQFHDAVLGPEGWTTFGQTLAAYCDTAAVTMISTRTSGAPISH
jgi:hypothetical protein